jgi:hypothetical protein
MVVQYESCETGAARSFESIQNAILLRCLGDMNVPSLSEQIAFLLFTTVNADQKRRTTPSFQDFLCHLRSAVDRFLPGQL